MKKVKFNPNLEGWSLDVFDKFNNVLLEAMSEVLDIALKGDESYLYFPYFYCKSDGIGGEKVADPLELYFRIGLDDGDGEKPTYSFNIRDAVNKVLSPEYINKDNQDLYKSFAESMRSLADDIDKAVDEANK